MKQEEAEKLLSLSAESYELIAADFDLTRKKALWPEIERLAGAVKEGESVLDAGCGNGRLLQALAGRQIDYVGVDKSHALIELAAKSYPDRKFFAADLLDEHAYPEELRSKKFDHIFCLAVLQHIPSRDWRQHFLINLRRQLKPGGRLIISSWNIWRSRNRPVLIRQIWEKITFRNRRDFGDLVFPWKNNAGEPVKERYYHAFTWCGLRRLAGEAGFKEIKIWRDSYNYWLELK